MAYLITSRNGESIHNKQYLKIGSSNDSEVIINIGFDFTLEIRYDAAENKCLLINKFNDSRFLFKGEILPSRLLIDKVCKIMVKDSEEYITIKILSDSKTIAKENQNIINFSNDENIQNRKNKIDERRVKIIKEIGAKISELQRKISLDAKFSLLLHIALFIAAVICSFGVSNYISGMPAQSSEGVIQMSVNSKVLLMYTIIIFSIGLMLKQGFFLFLQNKISISDKYSKSAEKITIVVSLIFFVSVYLINVLYYFTPKTIPIFAVLISLFYTGTVICLSLGCGYCKNLGLITKQELDTYEYRQDFEHVIREYLGWIEDFINILPKQKIELIQEKILKLKIKSIIEYILGILTAPFLAYGVSNTLAMCFPEAAGWVRISGLRFSPIFLILSTFLIIFAFFSFVNGFVTKKKINASEIIKHDGFSNYFHHGVNIYGLEGVKKLNEEKMRYFLIGLGIILIEFTMNVSYFVGEIGSNISGMLISSVAALVPTALLLAETLMLSQTNFEIFAQEELLTKMNR